jgi:flagellar L-ring protein precursor FlgH
MEMAMRAPQLRLIAAVLCVITISACGTLRDLSQIGSAPPLTPITNPTEKRGYEPVSLPMPAAETEAHQTNSLWRNGAKQFFRDQRAGKVGDILTVEISIADNAKLDNSTTRSRSGTDNMGLANLFGLENPIVKALPGATDPASLVKTTSDTATKGDGAIDRKETINLTVAAIVTQILPNGNLVIQGRQEVRVNFEVRELLVTGIVRPEDISNTNTIKHTQIAEARISYGGRGQISRLQQPRYGQQAVEILSPF